MKTVLSMNPMANFLKKWHYNPSVDSRDLRIDFMRGFVMLILVTVHINLLSFYNYVSWERFGVVTGAEGFVILSGLILGILYRVRLKDIPFKDTMNKQFNRSFLLYRTSIVVILLVFLMNLLPYVDASSVMTFTTYGGKVYNLYPDISMLREYHEIIMAKLFLLRYGPHQFQILGLYMILLFVSPFILWLLSKQRFGLVLALSWIIYFGSTGYNLRPTGAQFEYAFPVLTWQVLFVHGLVIGYYRHELWNFFHSRKGAITFGFITLLFLAFLFFTYNNPIGQLSDSMKLHFIDPETFKSIYHDFFQKNNLGIGRLVNDFVVLVMFYAILSYMWKPIYRVFGWFFVPIGQVSLYVFVIHIFLSIIITNITLFSSGNIWLNSLGHTLILMTIWFMVKYKVAFNIIPK